MTCAAPQRTLPDAGAGTTPHERGDVDGLRAVAVVLVVGFHAGLAGLHNGFVGVDVFFVISGFLITGLLVADERRGGSIRLAEFWARRARRLLPAVSVVLVAVLVAVQLIDSPVDWGATISDTLAATLYWSNYGFIARADAYFGASPEASPVLHTWTLAVEEQFYVVWPIVLVLVAAFAGRQRHRARIVVIGALAAASFALCMELTRSNPAGAFYSSLTRAWEFGLGGLLALAAPALEGLLRPLHRVAAGLLGVAVLVCGLVAIDASAGFPGPGALYPVVATLLLVGAGLGHGWAGGTLLAARPLQWIGRLSYSWYLWHWPVMLLGTRWLEDAEVATRTTLVLSSLVPAYISYRLIENPVRYAPSLVSSPRRTFVVIGGVVALTLAVAGVTHVRAQIELSDPVLALAADARADHLDLPLECAESDVEVLLTRCARGDLDGRTTAVVIGDSHANQWLPPISRAAERRGIRVIASVKGECPAFGPRSTRSHPSCRERVQELPRLIDSLEPDLVLVAHSSGYLGTLVTETGARMEPDEALDAWQRATTDFARRLAGAGIPLGIVLDNPRFDDNPIECLARHRDPDRCTLARSEVERALAPVHAAERAAVEGARHGIVLDPIPLLCSETVCPSVRDGHGMYTDPSHLTITHSLTLTAEVGRFLDEISRTRSR